MIEFDSDTPKAIIEKIVPDVLVKGGDYDPEETDENSKKYIVGRKVVKANGGEVKTIDLVEGFSTTGIIKSIEKMTIREAQDLVDNWIKTYGVRYFNELTNMAQLTEEVGEVARIIARRYGEQSEKESDKNKDLGDEMADVLWVLICLANQTGVDLEVALQKKSR